MGGGQNAGGSVWKNAFVGGFVFFVVMGNPVTQSSGRGSFFLGNILIRVKIEDGGRKLKVENGWLGQNPWFLFPGMLLYHHSALPGYPLPPKKIT